MFAGLLDARVMIAESAVGDQRAALFPQEAAAVARAVERRQLEFAAGRACARRALALLGEPTVALPPEPDRVPAWPPHLTGSITHTRTRCAAAVARRQDGIRAIGVDLEDAEPLQPELWPEILTSAELGWIATQDVRERGLLARAVFSAKECAFKCQHGVTRTMLEFADLEVAIHPARDGFTARFQRDVVPFQLGHTLIGRMRITADGIATAMVLENE